MLPLIVKQTRVVFVLHIGNTLTFLHEIEEMVIAFTSSTSDNSTQIHISVASTKSYF